MLLILLLLIGGLGATVWVLVRPPDTAALTPEQKRVRAVQVKLPVAAADEAPVVAPLTFSDISKDEARKDNAAIPFSTAPNPAAAPFVFIGQPLDRERAIDCLAAAVYYEAGDDPVGQQAVAQVVLNRVRHPAFPKTVCGTVFQGSDRNTGCQFTFTCDGALIRRRPSAAAWKRAQLVAMAALGGSVFSPVGWATHYHTDWVFPIWNQRMDKNAEVHTHLFYRWHGAWGRPGSFSMRGVGSVESLIAALQPLSPVHDPAQNAAGLLVETKEDLTTIPAVAIRLTPPSAAVPAEVTSALKGSVLRRFDSQTGTYYIALDAAQGSGSYAVTALNICEKVSPCRVFGWTEASAVNTARTPDAASMARLSFFYGRGGSYGSGTALWNCKQFQRPSARQCLPENFAGWGGLRAVGSENPSPTGTPSASSPASERQS